jgi:NADH/NAD ratio-sensing transcriptional regulator Rex
MNYIETYGEIFELINNKMQGLRESNYKVGIFGAGHLACAFIHYFKTSQFFDFCFDDTPSKVGKFLPGTTIPIIKPTVDNLSKVQVCLTAISLSNEGALMQRFTEFTSQGGKFLSIFRNSSNSIFDY